MATLEPPVGETPPICACGQCGERVNWMPGKGWATYRKGHAGRGKPGTRRGAVLSRETKDRMSESAKRRYAGKRRRDLEETPGPGVYATHEYHEAKQELVEGKPCIRCGTMERVYAHHETPGDDSTLIPLCIRCHPTEHAAPDAKGRHPPPGEQGPLCKCGCGLRTNWKRVRGWAEYRKGHGGAKVPAGTRNQSAPECKCGCGEKTSFRYGHGWNEYKTGHRQRVEGTYHERIYGPRPLCKCGCGQRVVGQNRYIPGHRKIKAGRKPPIGEQPPKCACNCGGDVGWVPGHGWSKWIRNHDKRGKSRK